MTEKQNANPTRRGGIVGPVLLIAAGIFFLLSNLGIITMNFWDVAWRLWPIVLIAIGLDLLIGRRSIWSSLIVLLVTVGVLAAGFFWLIANDGWAGNEVTETISQPLSGAESADVDIDFGVGRVNLDALSADSDELIAGTIQIPDEIRVEQSFNMDGDVARYRLQTEGSVRSAPFLGDSGSRWRWDLQINPDVPLSLSLDTGVGQTTLDLRQLTLETLNVDTGVGETTVMLPGRGRIDASISGGVGQLTVELPAGVPARIQVDTGLGGTDVEGDFEQNGNVYISPNYEDAPDRIDLRLSAGVGQVNVRTYGGR